MLARKNEIQLRFAEQSDVPEILALLRAGLGETLTQKTEEYWHWKHTHNPFGPSLVLLATYGEQIIGVRTFMRWNWRIGTEIIPSVRGVDTVIRADFQGNGLFGKLSLELLKHSKKLGCRFLYSTPNEKSKKGYRRLGWDEASTLSIRVKVVRPLSILGNLLLRRSTHAATPDSAKVTNFLNHADFPDLLRESSRVHEGRIVTAHDTESLRWRYATVPVGNYSAFGIEWNNHLNGVCFYRIKQTRLGREMRITDCFLKRLEDMKELALMLPTVVAETQVDYVTSGSFFNPQILSPGPFTLIQRFGPGITRKNIFDDNNRQYVEFSRWSPSLGDLELF